MGESEKGRGGGEKARENVYYLNCYRNNLSEQFQLIQLKSNKNYAIHIVDETQTSAQLILVSVTHELVL